MIDVLWTVVALCATTVSPAQQPFDVDPSFQTTFQVGETNAMQGVGDLYFLPDGRIMVSGQVRLPDELFSRTGVRLFQDGSLDMGFPVPFIWPSYMGGRITPWGDKFYCASGQGIRRLNGDWSLDELFDIYASYPTASVFQGGDYHVYPDGSLLVSGGVDLNDPVRGYVGYYRLVWFTNTGWLDTTRTHRQANGDILAFRALHPEGPHAGQFVCTVQGPAYDGHEVAPVFRIFDNGDLDTTFQAPLQGWGYSSALVPLEDGRLMVGGYRRLIGSDSTMCVMRLMDDGSLDPSFQLPRFSDDLEDRPWVFEIEILEDQRMIVTGDFDAVDGYERRGIVMLHWDGTVDTTVFNDAGCEPYVFGFGETNMFRAITGIHQGPDGMFYIQGSYHGYDDGTQSYPDQRFITRLYGLDVGVREQERLRFTLAPNPASGTAALQLQDVPAQGRVLLRDALGRTVLHVPVQQTTTALPLEGLAAGVHVVELWSGARRLGYERLVVVP